MRKRFSLFNAFCSAVFLCATSFDNRLFQKKKAMNIKAENRAI